MSDRPPPGWIAPLAPRRPPDASTREGRVRLIGEFAEAIDAGRSPSREATLFVVGALREWLERGGSLERDFFCVVKSKSHRTAAAIWREHVAARGAGPHRDEGQGAGTGGRSVASNSENEENPE